MLYGGEAAGFVPQNAKANAKNARTAARKVGFLVQYLISFLEGIVTFISPCLLPMLPVYISYFAGGRPEEANRKRALRGALGFVCGFTLIFVLLGAFAGSLGRVFREYTTIVNLVTGAVVVVFGLNFAGILKLKLLNQTFHRQTRVLGGGFFASLVFGAVFSIGWTPCVGAFLGSALLLASQQGSVAQGIVMLLCYSLGLGIPFVVSALLIERLKTTFLWIKTHYAVINKVAGGLLIVMGILMMTGYMGYFLSLLSF